MLIAADASEPVDVLGRFVFDDVDHVVDGNGADQPVLIIDDRDREQVVVGDILGHLFLIRVDPGADQVGGHDALQRRLSGHQQQTAQGDDPDQMPSLIDDVEIEHHLYFARTLQGLNRFTSGQVLRQREHRRVHDPTGGLLRVVQQVLDLAGLARPHLFEHDVRQVLWELVDQRRGVIRRQLLQPRRNAVRRVVGQQHRRRLRPVLDQRLHREVAVVIEQQRECAATVFVG